MLDVPPSSYTLADLLQKFDRDVLCYRAPRTQYHYRLLYRWLCERYGTLALPEITTGFLRRWRDEMSQQFQPSTVRSYMATLGSALTAAVDDFEWLDAQPMRHVRKPPVPPARVRFLSDSERTCLLHACQQSSNAYLYTIVMMALMTGARKNELCQLRWPDVDLAQGLLRLMKTKNKRPRSVPVVGESLTLLRTHAEGQWSPWVFPRPDGVKALLIDHAWRQAVRRARLSDFRFHDLRHTAASYLAMSGASLREIAEILGHTNIQQTMKYAHLVEPHTRGVLERMAQQFLQG